MALEQSAWRLGDAALYEKTMGLADELLAELARTFRSGTADAVELRAEAAELRVSATVLDGFDRDAVRAHQDEWSARLIVLRGAT